MEAYCMKCKAKKEMKDVVETVSKNNRIMWKGVCPECGTKMNRMGGVANK